MIFGTPPIDTINIEEELTKMSNIQEEYKKIYKKSIVMKDYFIKDWIEILDFLGLPVIKALGEADPLCAYMLKNNPHIYGIISDDSDMLVVGAPLLMRKSINQQFTIIELKKILNKIELLLLTIYEKYIRFDIENLIDYSILLGTDYGNFKLNENKSDSLELLKYYISNDKNYKFLISPDDYDKFIKIKKYYLDQNYDEEYAEYLSQPKWKKPKLMELKKRLLELKVDEDYIDKNNKFLDFCYNKINNNNIFLKSINYDNYDNNFNKYKINDGFKSNSFDSKKLYYVNKIQDYLDIDFNKIKKNQTFYSEKIYHNENKNNYKNINDNNFNDESLNCLGYNKNNKYSFENFQNDEDIETLSTVKNDKDIESLSNDKNDYGIFFFEK
jgi:hypothetical protein